MRIIPLLCLAFILTGCIDYVDARKEVPPDFELGAKVQHRLNGKIGIVLTQHVMCTEVKDGRPLCGGSMISSGMMILQAKLASTR